MPRILVRFPVFIQPSLGDNPVTVKDGGAGRQWARDAPCVKEDGGIIGKKAWSDIVCGIKKMRTIWNRDYDPYNVHVCNKSATKVIPEQCFNRPPKDAYDGPPLSGVFDAYRDVLDRSGITKQGRKKVGNRTKIQGIIDALPRVEWPAVRFAQRICADDWPLTPVLSVCARMSGVY
eukprot:gene17083-741_t